MKATSEWFPAQERGLAGGVFNIGASFGSMLAPPLVAWAILTYNWQSAFVMTGALGLVWVVLWLWLYQSPATHTALSDAGTPAHPVRPGAAPAGRRHAAVDRRDSRAAQLLGDRAAAVPRGSDLGHADFLAAALSDEGAALRSETDRAVRVAAVPCRRSRLPVRRHDQPDAPEALRHQPDQRPARRVHGGRAA